MGLWNVDDSFVIKVGPGWDVGAFVEALCEATGLYPMHVDIGPLGEFFGSHLWCYAGPGEEFYEVQLEFGGADEPFLEELSPESEDEDPATEAFTTKVEAFMRKLVEERNVLAWYPEGDINNAIGDLGQPKLSRSQPPVRRQGVSPSKKRKAKRKAKREARWKARR